MNVYYPERVWINQPSTHQPLHKYHGKVGISVKNEIGVVVVYFTEGPVRSMVVPERYLEVKHE